MATALAPEMPAFPVHRFRVDQYERMIAAGILTEDDPLELIRGWVVPKSPTAEGRALAIELLSPLLTRAVWGSASVRVRSSLTLPVSVSVPEPDFVICVSARKRGVRHPRPADTFLVAEVTDSARRGEPIDRLALYAEDEIPVCWVVNLVDRRVEVYEHPEAPAAGGPRYRTRGDYVAGQAVPVVVGGNAVGHVPVADILP